jgi:hypothetical protein
VKLSDSDDDKKYQEEVAVFQRLALAFGADPAKLDLLLEGFEEAIASMQEEAFAAAFGNAVPVSTQESNVNVLLGWLRLRAPHLFKWPN